MQLTPHFSLSEMEHSETALRLGIDNAAPQQAILNLRHLCQQVLEPLRQWYARPIHISSGYRSPQLNRAVGGAAHSQHITGEAADITAPHADLLRLFDHILHNLPFDQLILEHTSSRIPNYWLHVSCRPALRQNRHQSIRSLVKKFYSVPVPA